ncbi:Replication initiation and membrane attachment protein [Paraliobacillus sp. PM-2]|uniref:replication initiation and membrane attachment family protein n=1 Tax=Paraliobacillus sp. PM-2 TaxID=1462524 RepID=UPI00061C9869|nr:DnaD domain protein [Paraliobacillus sp. PM-2]CQR48098.1 Replication initiation and membrane attachment protein [Paraliobacillus sp. PM-2]
MEHIGKLLPNQGYSIYLKQEFTHAHLQSLMQLYQPLIGVHAVSLFMTLLSQYESSPNKQDPYTHHSLMQFVNLSLPEIYQARQKLEAIGLLETYQLDNDNETIFTYQLMMPCTPLQFFSDGMLSQLLYHQIGADKTNELYQLYAQGTKQNRNRGTNITAQFDEIFQKAPVERDMSVKAIDTIENQGPNISGTTISINDLSQLLSERMLPVEKILTPFNIKIIQQMASLYDLTTLDIEKAVVWALSDQYVLIEKEFKSACFDLYKQVTPESSKSLKVVDQKEKLKTKKDKPTNRQDQFVQMLEEISPRQLLEDLSNGNQASKQDLKMIADVMSQQGLTPGVMNVLIHYVMLKTDMKLTKSYLEKIASHWARKNVKTVRQAMTLAKSEHNKYQQWSTQKKPRYQKSGKKEVVPDWFRKQKDKQEQDEQKIQNEQQSSDSTSDVSELLRDYNKKKNHL